MIPITNVSRVKLYKNNNLHEKHRWSRDIDNTIGQNQNHNVLKAVQLNNYVNVSIPHYCSI